MLAVQPPHCLCHRRHHICAIFVRSQICDVLSWINPRPSRPASTHPRFHSLSFNPKISDGRSRRALDQASIAPSTRRARTPNTARQIENPRLNPSCPPTTSQCLGHDFIIYEYTTRTPSPWSIVDYPSLASWDTLATFANSSALGGTLLTHSLPQVPQHDRCVQPPRLKCP